MKTKSKNLKKNHHLKPKILFLFFFLIPVCCILPAQSIAQISYEHLDPVNLLMPVLDKQSHLTRQIQKENQKTLQDVNIPAVSGTTHALVQDFEQSIHATKLQQKTQQQLQTKADSIEPAPVNFAAQVTQELPETGFISMQNPSNNLKRRLWQARITTPIENADRNNTSKNELQLIIEQIRSITFEPKSMPEPVISIEPTPKTEPNQTPFDTKKAKETEKKQAQNQLPYEPLTGQTLETLRNLSQHPDQLDNPFELAEVLFLSGHPKEAALFYREALNRTSSDNVDSARDKAWILFQIANCLQDDDPPTAMKTYRQLITEYPDSPWIDLAKARDKIIDWYTKEKPQTLITDSITTEPQE